MHYVWLIWSGAFLLPWLLLYALNANYRRVMLWSSILTAPFGLTEPLVLRNIKRHIDKLVDLCAGHRCENVEPVLKSGESGLWLQGASHAMQIH